MVTIIGELGRIELVTPSHDGLVITKIVPAELLDDQKLVRNVVVEAMVETMPPPELGDDHRCPVGILRFRR